MCAFLIPKQAIAQVGDLPCKIQLMRTDSGFIASPKSTRSVVWETVIREPNAVWMRLRFDELRLPISKFAGQNAELHIISFADGAIQILDAETAREWGKTSAFFNGNALLVQLVMSPETPPARVTLSEVTVGLSAEINERTICGDEDDRVRWQDPRIARVLGDNGSTYVPVCTAWLIQGTGRDLLTAGHCVWASPPNCDVYQPWQVSVIEFNVPLSDSFGNPQFADPSDQYAVDANSLQHSNGCAAVGEDWCYFGVYPNSVTGLDPLWQQGGYYQLPETYPDLDGSPIIVAGYGVDNWPNVDNLALQAEWGMFNNVVGTIVAYTDLDTESGCSGAPIEKVSEGVAVGIHTHGACDDPDYWHNYGTAINHPDIQYALANPIGICAAPVLSEVASRCFTVSAHISQGVEFTEIASRSFVVAVNITSEPQFYEIASRAFTVEYDPDWTPPCLEDINGDGYVNVSDLLTVIDQWGQTDSPADVNNDGIVDVSDLLILIAAWGPCE